MKPATPFFRFPGFALRARMSHRRFVVFGADVWTGDWVQMDQERELRRILSRIDHDTKAQTAQMLPAVLRELTIHGYRIVHVVPK